MSIFKCSKCGCVENTALSRYWVRDFDKELPLCSECDPKIGKWHDSFDKKNVSEVGYFLGNDGFLYHPKEVEDGSLEWREKCQGFKILGTA